MKTAGQKSKLYSKYGTQLYVTAKNGVPDPESNPALRMLIDRAKRDQVPAHVIEKAIEKAKGGGGDDYSSSRYEGFGPNGSQVIVDCLTNNANRSITEVRNCFTRSDCKLGPAGCVSHMFDHLAIFSFEGEDGDAVLEAMLEADVDVDDVETKDGKITLFAPATEFFKAKTAMTAAFPDTKMDVEEVTWHPQTYVNLEGDDVTQFEKLLAHLEDCEDVSEVFHNAILPG
jgi:YebC/PmpR family DNA-binding regulatory protein